MTDAEKIIYVKEDKDIILAAKYLKAIADGIDTYKPADLKVESVEKVSQETIPDSDLLNRTIYQDSRNQISFI